MVKRKQGHIVFMSSVAGKVPAAGASIYNATKFGIRGFGLAMREELWGTAQTLDFKHDEPSRAINMGDQHAPGALRIRTLAGTFALAILRRRLQISPQIVRTRP